MTEEYSSKINLYRYSILNYSHFCLDIAPRKNMSTVIKIRLTSWNCWKANSNPFW